MYTLVYDNKLEAPDGTGYNNLPFNWKEITEDEFVKSGFITSNWKAVEFRQMYPKGERRLIEARLFWFNDDTGVAISRDYYAGKVHYYKFGCHHTLKHEKFSTEGENICPNCKTDISQPWMSLVTADTGWSLNNLTSRPNRGIRDYDRTITFTRVLSANEQSAVAKYLANVDCPGWTGVTCRPGGTDYRFSTTYDSSD